jgi:hypothetical protein
LSAPFSLFTTSFFTFSSHTVTGKSQDTAQDIMIVGKVFMAAAMAATALAAPADQLVKDEVRQAGSCGALCAQCGGQSWTGATCCEIRPW